MGGGGGIAVKWDQYIFIQVLNIMILKQSEKSSTHWFFIQWEWDYMYLSRSYILIIYMIQCKCCISIAPIYWMFANDCKSLKIIIQICNVYVRQIGIVLMPLKRFS